MMKMLIGVDKHNRIKQIRNITDSKLTQYDVDESLFVGMSDIRILNYSYEVTTNGFMIYPTISDYHLDLIEMQDELLKIKKKILPDTEVSPVDKISVLNAKIKFIDNYKHEARLYFPYGNCGGIQRFTTDDITLINLTIDGLKDRTIDTVKWKYGNGGYDVVDKITYFDEMKRIGGRLTVKAFAIEEVIVNELKLLETIDDLLLYDEKARFDELFYDVDDGKK